MKARSRTKTTSSSFTLQKSAFALTPLMAAMFASSPVVAQEQRESFYEEITIVGSTDDARQVTGSAHFIGPDELARYSYADIQRMVRQVPGVSIQLEDGYGLRPNISIRGVATERSSRITLLEDNILIAPAPYAAPAAYYFPTAGRLHAVEVVKGPAAITQGPLTIGGALNMVSTPVPLNMEGKLQAEVAENNTWRVLASYGGTTDSGLGFLLETHQWQSDGFQNIDRSSENSGLDLQDYTVKLAWAPTDSRHRAELKLQRVEQDSNQSYLGLTDDDFRASPFRRYGVSALDNITTAHDQGVLRYEFDLSESTALSVAAYRNEHARDWYKTEGIDLEGSSDADSLSRTSWSAIVDDINRGQSRDGFTSSQLQAILDGTADTAPGSIDVRSNNREYLSQGIQFGLASNFRTGAASHALEIGVRIHEDEEDRLQYDSSYQQLDGQLVLNDIGELGAAGNRLSEAEAVAWYVYDRIEMGRWTLTPGLRYEDIELTRTDYSNGSQRVVSGTRSNEVEVWLPGLGVAYAINDSTSLIGGVHKGFTAPGSSPGAREEEAINYELGVRGSAGTVGYEVMGFLSDYDNLLGVCTASSGADCVIGEAFNGEAATVRGIEFMAQTEFQTTGNLRFPLQLSYTWVDAQFDTDIADTDFFGDVSRGDPIPYIPEQQWLLSAGMETGQWNLNLSASYRDDTCVVAACGAFQKTQSALIFDVSANYVLREGFDLYGRIENLTAEERIQGRQPYGARPGMDRTATLGLRFSF